MLNRKLRIKFSIEEISLDGTPIEDPITLKFGDDVLPAEIRDFFDRCTRATSEIFRCFVQNVEVRFASGPINNKIPCIKIIRTMTGYGLKEAKNILESNFPGIPPGVIGYVRNVEEFNAIAGVFMRDAAQSVVLGNVIAGAPGHVPHLALNR